MEEENEMMTTTAEEPVGRNGRSIYCGDFREIPAPLSEKYVIEDEKREKKDEEEKKFKLLTDEENTIKIGSYTLHRIECIKEISNLNVCVKVGEKGGYVESEKNIRDDAWVGGDAKVFDNAIVMDCAYVTDRACVAGDAIVADFALVEGDAEICEHARIDSRAQISGKAYITGHANVSDKAHIKGNAHIQDYATVQGGACIQDKVAVKDDAVINGSVIIKGNVTIGQNAYIKYIDQYMSFENVGSRNDVLTAYNTKYGGVRIKVGCFLGSVDEFKNKVLTTHEKEEKIKNEYLLILEVIKNRFGINV